MDEKTVNRIYDSLTSLADNAAEQERIFRGLAAIINSLKYDVSKEELTKGTENDRLTRIEKLLEKALEDAKTRDKGFPYVTGPLNPQGPSDWPPLPPITCSIKATPCSTQKISAVYAGVTPDTVKTINKPL